MLYSKSFVILLCICMFIYISGQEPMVIQIDSSQVFQEVYGFGASLTDSSAWLLYHVLDEHKRQEILEELFSPDKGIGLTYLRQPMGASDFALKNYTYSPYPGDYNLDHFSIAYEEKYIIPILQQIQAICPDVQIMGSPWSAPAWMKESNSLFSGRLRQDCYATYAKYFSKYVQAFGKHLLPIHAITLQNEPYFEPKTYPGMLMEIEDQRHLAIAVGEEFQKEGISTKIVIWDHNWDHPEVPIAVLSDPTASKYITGIAFHCYGGDVAAQSFVASSFPDKEIFFTECSGGEWANNFSDNLLWDASVLVIGSTRHWARTVLKWNLVLDEKHGPQNNGCGDCRGILTLSQTTKEVIRNEEYYALGHASKFVRPGAYRIFSTNMAPDVPNVAYMNKDKSIVWIATNSKQEPQEVTIVYQTYTLGYTIPARAVVTLVWHNHNSKCLPLVRVWLSTGDKKNLLTEQSSLFLK